MSLKSNKLTRDVVQCCEENRWLIADLDARWSLMATKIWSWLRKFESLNLMATKIWSSFHPRNFGSHVTVRPSDRPDKPMRNLTFSGWWVQVIAVKTGYPRSNITWPYRGLSCRPSRLRVFWSYLLTSYEFSTDRRFDSKWISLQQLQIYCLK